MAAHHHHLAKCVLVVEVGRAFQLGKGLISATDDEDGDKEPFCYFVHTVSIIYHIINVMHTSLASVVQVKRSKYDWYAKVVRKSGISTTLAVFFILGGKNGSGKSTIFKSENGDYYTVFNDLRF